MLARGYTVRGTRPGDVEAAQAVVDAAQTALMGEPRRGEIEVATACRDPRLDLTTNTWVAEAPGGAIAGFAGLFWAAQGHGEADVYVHPEHLGRGIGVALLDAVGRRAAVLARSAPEGAAPRLHVWCDVRMSRRRAALLDRGFSVVRESYLMRIDFDHGAPLPAPLPAGVEVRAFRRGRDEAAVYAASEEAFADHFLFDASTLEEWKAHTVDHPRCEPDLWLVAWDGDEVAGETMVFLDELEGCVDSLSVRPLWRGRGMGLALLTRAFELVHARDRSKVRLWVDAMNPTGALALYQRAGMRVEHRNEVFAKDLRA
jgi:mycothiol synthase